MMTKPTWIVLALMILPIANMAALDWDLTVSGGVSLPGEIVATDDLKEENFHYELRKPTALLAKIALDLYPFPWLGGSVFMYTGEVPLNKELFLGFWDDHEHKIPASGISILAIGGSLKGRVEFGGRRYMKPSIGWVYLHSFSESPDALMDGFVVIGEMEYEYPLTTWLGGVAQLGVAFQPYGGVKDVAYITFGPIFYLTLGVVL